MLKSVKVYNKVLLYQNFVIYLLHQTIRNIMTNFKTNDKNQDLNNFNSFRNKHGNGDDGFETLEIASEFANLKRKWWGSNLVFLGIEEKNNRFYPTFNVFD
jgi:hypothetical protein